MAIDRSIPVFRRAPYWFASALAVMLLQFIWLSPVPSILATAAVSGGVAILVHCLASRIGREAVSILTLLIMLMPGLHVTSEQPPWGVLMYASVFYFVVTGFYAVLFGIERARRHC